MIARMTPKVDVGLLMVVWFEPSAFTGCGAGNAGIGGGGGRALVAWWVVGIWFCGVAGYVTV